MTTFVYAIDGDDGNHLKTITAQSRKAAEEKIIERLRDKYDIDDEFDSYREFQREILDYDISISDLVDIDTL
jgi:hypothetical protein